MPNLIFADDVLEARYYTYHEETRQIGINTVHYKVAEITADPSIQNTVDELSVLVSDHFKALMPAGARYSGCTLRRVDPGPASPSAVSRSGAGPGDHAGNMIPNQVSAICRLYTSEASRHGRGRIYLPFLPTTGVLATGEVDPVFQALVETEMAAVIPPDPATIVVADVGGPTWEGYPIVWAPTTTGTFRVESLFCPPRLATQKRRGDYGKMNIEGP